MLTPEQIAGRKNYIGGSDAAKILGLSRWGTPLSVWAEKTGQIPSLDISDRLETKLGNMLEPVVGQLFRDATGKKIVAAADTKYLPGHPFIGGNLDFWVTGESAFLEVKTTNSFQQKDWESDDEEEIPAEYILQCYHYLNVTDFQYAYIAVLIGNRQFLWRKIERDEKALAALLAKEVYFWDEYIVKKVMPPPVWNDKDTLDALFPVTEEGNKVILPPEIEKTVEYLAELQEEEKALGEKIETEKNKLRMALGTNETGETNKYLIVWKGQTTRRLDTARMKKEEPAIYDKFATEIPSRVLRYKIKNR